MFGLFENKNEPEFKYNLGADVKDPLTGYSGIIMCRNQWLHGCNTYGVKSRQLKEGTPIHLEYFDEGQLELVTDNGKAEKKTTGGPCSIVPEPNR